MRRAGTVAVPVAVVLVASLVAGCTGDDDVRPEGTRSPTTTAAAPSTTAEAAPRAGPLAPFYEQRLRWSACHGGFRCARLEVPLDYARPQGRTIELAVVRLPRSGDGLQRSLLLNPGGPGGSGVDYALAADSVVSKDVRRRYDIVGFDPRGVQRSAPVSCLSDADLDVFVSIDGSPDTPAEEQALQQEWSRLGAGCVDRRSPRTWAPPRRCGTSTCCARRSATGGSPSWASPTGPTWGRPTPSGSRTASAGWSWTARSTRRRPEPTSPTARSPASSVRATPS